MKPMVGMRTKSGDEGNPLPDSRIFAAGDAPSFPPALMGLHVGGCACEDLPPAVWHLLDFQHTDEGIAERNKGKVESAAREVQGPLGKAIEERRDFRRDSLEPWEAPDPMKSLAAANVAPGMRPKFLSENRLNKEGNFARGFEVVRGENGDPVRLGTLVLAQMPEELAERRNETYREKSNSALRAIREKSREAGVRAEQEVVRRSGSDVAVPVAPLKRPSPDAPPPAWPK